MCATKAVKQGFGFLTPPRKIFIPYLGALSCSCGHKSQQYQKDLPKMHLPDVIPFNFQQRSIICLSRLQCLHLGLDFDDPPREWFRLLLRDARTTVSAWQELQMTQCRGILCWHSKEKSGNIHI